MGVPAPVIEVFTTAGPLTNKKGVELNAEALGVDANGNWGTPVVSCQVRFSPLGQKQSAEGGSTSSIAHEVFHCFQFALADISRSRHGCWKGPRPGRATSPPVPTARAAWTTTSRTSRIPQAHLFGRAYDAVGFWGWTEQAGGADALWARMPAIHTNATNGKAFALARGVDPGFLDGWASASFRYPGAGSAWNQKRPFAVPYTEVKLPATVVDADTDLAALAFTLRQYLVERDPIRSRSCGWSASPAVCAPAPRRRTSGRSMRSGSASGSANARRGRPAPFPRINPWGRTSSRSARREGQPTPRPGSSTTISTSSAPRRAPASRSAGATSVTIGDPGYCVRPFPGVFQVQLPLNAGGKKIAQVVLEIAGFNGAGACPTGPSVATVYDFRAGPAHLWETPVSGDITVQNPGGAAGEGAFGTVGSVTRGTSVDLGTTTVNVSGAWSCR